MNKILIESYEEFRRLDPEFFEYLEKDNGANTEFAIIEEVAILGKFQNDIKNLRNSLCEIFLYLYILDKEQTEECLNNYQKLQDEEINFILFGLIEDISSVGLTDFECLLIVINNIVKKAGYENYEEYLIKEI